MIQTKLPIIYGDRDERIGQIMIEVRPMQMSLMGIKYLVIDWDISKEPKDAWKSKEIFYDVEKINQLDIYLESKYDMTGMSKIQKEWLKIITGLMLDTQTNLLTSGKTIYRLTPEDWEFSSEVIEMFPFLIEI